MCVGRSAIRAPEREMRILPQTGVSSAWAELLLARMLTKADNLCRQREALRAVPPHAAGIKKMDAEARMLTVGSKAAVAEFKTIAIFCDLVPLLSLTA